MAVMRRAAAILSCLFLVIAAQPLMPKSTNAYGFTNTDPASFANEKKLERALEAYPVLLECAAEERIVIPGLQTTLSLNQKDKAETCTKMIPQGLAMNEDWIFVSAYCHDKQHNSVVYMISRKTGQYEKTVVLSDRSHVGSVTWDETYKHLWLSTGSTGKASASYLRIRDMEKYDFAKTKEALPYAYRSNIATLERNSFMTWYKDCLYAGTFTETAVTMRLQQFSTTTQGHLKQSASSAAILSSNIIARECQGIAMDGKFVYMTYSNGPYLPSTLCIYRAGQDRYLRSDALKTILLPPCLEQPYVEDGTLYLLWESAGWPFRNDRLLHMDRILSLDVKKLLDYEA
jgi:hypothetical protein